MKILNLYIGKSLIFTTFIAMAVLSFVMMAGHLIQVLFFTAKGMSAVFVLKYLMYMMPNILSYVLPIAILCSTILVFSKMSADNEITAMKACGISLWQIISPVLFLSIICSCCCIYLLCVLKPQCRLASERLKREVNIVQPTKLLEAGRAVEFSSGKQTFFLYVQKIEDNDLENIRIHVLDENGEILLNLFAASGELIEENDPKYKNIYPNGALVLNDVFIRNNSSKLKGVGQGLGDARMDRLTYPIVKNVFQISSLVRNQKFLTWREILARIIILRETSNNVSVFYLELSSRLALAFSPIAFVFLGIPFGIRSRRSETSVGVITAFLLAGLFFIFFLSGSMFKSIPWLGVLVMWLPNLAYQFVGIRAISIVEKR